MRSCTLTRATISPRPCVRDDLVKELGVQLIVGSVQDLIDRGRRRRVDSVLRNAFRPQPSSRPSSNTSSTRVSAAPGAMRKRPAPRSASSATGTTSASGIPRTSAQAVGPLQRQAPAGEHFGLPAQQLDGAGHLELHPPGEHRHPEPLAHEREVVRRNGQILAHSEYLNLRPDEKPETAQVRFRTLEASRSSAPWKAMPTPGEDGG